MFLRHLEYIAGSPIQTWRAQYLARAHVANRTYREDTTATLHAHYNRIRLENLDTHLPATHAQLDVILGRVADLFTQAGHPLDPDLH